MKVREPAREYASRRSHGQATSEMSSEECRRTRGPAGVIPRRSRMPFRSTQQARGIHVAVDNSSPPHSAARLRAAVFVLVVPIPDQKYASTDRRTTLPRSYATNATMPAATPHTDAPTIHTRTYIFVRSNSSRMRTPWSYCRYAPGQAPENVKTIGIDIGRAQWELRREPLWQSAYMTIRDGVRRPLHRSRL